MKDVACWRIVDDDRVLEIPANLAQVLDVVALVVVAALAEQSVVDNVVDVQLVKQRVAILGNRRSEDDNLVELTDALEEGINARSFYDIHVVILAFDFHGYCEVCLV